MIGEKATRYRSPNSAESIAKMKATKALNPHRKRTAWDDRGITLVSKTCKNCGNIFEVNTYEAITRVFCSRSCHYAYQRAQNPAKYFWIQQAQKALERDNHTCQMCFTEVDGRLAHVHHKTPRTEFGDDYKRMHRLSNLITLCAGCHRKHHTPWNKGKTYSEEYRRKLSEAHQGKPWSAERRAAFERNRK